jgi:hypothetical protein
LRPGARDPVDWPYAETTRIYSRPALRVYEGEPQLVNTLSCALPMNPRHLARLAGSLGWAIMARAGRSGSGTKRSSAQPTVRIQILNRTPNGFYRKHLIALYHRWFTFSDNTMRENAHGETDPR